MKTILRFVSALALAAVALSASAQVTYSLSAGLDSFSVVTSTYVATTTRFGASSLVGARPGILSILFDYEGRDDAPPPVIRIETSDNGTGFFLFQTGAFLSNGVKLSEGGTPLTVSGQPSPEPSAFVALGVGALALVKRRKRA